MSILEKAIFRARIVEVDVDATSAVVDSRHRVLPPFRLHGSSRCHRPKVREVGQGPAEEGGTGGIEHPAIASQRSMWPFT